MAHAFKWHVAVAIMAGCFLAAGDDAATRRDIDEWQGVWHAISVDNDGQPTPAEKLEKIKLTVRGTDYHFQNGGYSERGTYKFDVAKSPRQLDIIVGDGPDKGKVHQTIYKIDGDRLTLCFEAAGKARPAQFTGQAGTGCVLEVWQRSKR
jgi:uncharacterized protein (TIGR03067 family)